MSCHSYTTYTCTFPASTPTHNLSDWEVSEDLAAGTRTIEFDAETSWAESVLSDLTALFGRRLDEVPDLKLELHYSCDDDDHFEFTLSIEDGKCEYEEGIIQYVKRPMRECPVDLTCGTPDYVAHRVWRSLENVCIDENECIDRPYHGEWYGFGFYPKGTPREEIWHDLEDRFGVSVHDLMFPNEKE